MSWPEIAALFVAALAAGTINSVVGSGTLITFPTLLALGVPPVTANIANTTGLAFGSWSAVAAGRPELEGQRTRLWRLAPASIVGGLLGGVLLLRLPERIFSGVVPILIGVSVLLVAFQPRISAWVANRHATVSSGGQAHWVWPAVFGAGVYGGYFGAAQGIMLMAILGNGVDDSLQRLNATKNVCSAWANSVAALLFVATAYVDWQLAAILAIGSIVGGQVGAPLARRLPTSVLRGLIVVVGSSALVVFVLRG